jgi:hypothetical protein
LAISVGAEIAGKPTRRKMAATDLEKLNKK